MDNFIIQLPEGLGEAKLPDPALVQEWKELSSRRIVIDYEIDAGLSLVSRQIIEFNKEDKNIPIEERKKIFIYVDSPGGEVYSAIALKDVISISKTPIVLVNIGVTASAATILYLGAKERFAFPGSKFLIHQGSVAIGGQSTSVEETIQEYKRVDKEIEDALLSATKITKNAFNQKEKN